MEGAQATTQKLMVYGMPLFFGFFGFRFPIGVLVYWLTTNVWTFGQQFFVIKAMGDDPEAVVKARKAKECHGQLARGQEAGHHDRRAATGKSAAKSTGQANGTGAGGRAARARDVERRHLPPQLAGQPQTRPGRQSSGQPKRKGGRH